MLGVSVSSDNTTVIHNVSIITVCPTSARKNNHTFNSLNYTFQVAHLLLKNKFSLYYLISFFSHFLLESKQWQKQRIIVTIPQCKN